MKFITTKLKDVFIIELEKLEDERGFFVRAFDDQIFAGKKLKSKIIQSNISFNKKIGTIRGMHYQTHPYEEAKLVACIRGSVFEVMIDLRPESPTFKKWDSHELNSEQYRMLYVPEGFALGFQTLEDNTEVFYQMFQRYMPKHGRGIRWDDPAFNISWSLKPTVISKKDLSYDSFDEEKITTELTKNS